MSIMSDIQNEIMKPVKVGFYILSAVMVVGGLVIGANSKPGRKFFKKISSAATGKSESDNKKLENKSGDVVIDVEAEEVKTESAKIENTPKGSENV